MDDSDELFNSLLRHKFFKPHQLTINADALNVSLNQEVPGKYLEVFLALARSIIFETASNYKLLTQEIEKDFENNLSELPPEMHQLAKLLYKTYAIGLQNGTIDYANSLIETLEQKELLNAGKN